MTDHAGIAANATDLDPVGLRPRAAIWSGPADGFAIADLRQPQLRPGEVLVEIELSTICGSDLHTINGDRETPLPTVLGHESVGRIADLGGPVSDSTGAELQVGDRITWTIGTSCGQCRRCRRGVPQKCVRVLKYGHQAIDEHWQLNGGFGSHCHLLPGTGLVRVPDDLPAAVAAPANCATATVACAARRVGLQSDDVVVVLGCGMLGLTAVAYARDRGVETVIASDVDPDRRLLAASFGATAIAGPDDLSDLIADQGADVIFELSGNSKAVQSAVGLVDLDGRVALVGSVSPAPTVSFEPSSYVKNLTSLVGSHNYRVDDLVRAIDFLSRTPVQPLLADLVSDPFPLQDIGSAVAHANRAVVPRVAIAMD